MSPASGLLSVSLRLATKAASDSSVAFSKSKLLNASNAFWTVGECANCFACVTEFSTIGADSVPPPHPLTPKSKREDVLTLISAFLK